MKERKSTMFLSKISIHSCMIIHYIMEENVFFIVCKLLEQQKNWNIILYYFKINGKQTTVSKKCEYIKFKHSGRKIKSLLINYADFESILVPEDNGKQNPN